MAKPLGSFISVQATSFVLKAADSPPGANAIVGHIDPRTKEVRFFKRDNAWNFTEVPSKKAADGSGYELADGTKVGQDLSVNGQKAHRSTLHEVEARKLGSGDYTAAPDYQPHVIKPAAPAVAAAAPAPEAETVPIKHDATLGEKRVTPGQLGLQVSPADVAEPAPPPPVQAAPVTYAPIPESEMTPSEAAGAITRGLNENGHRIQPAAPAAVAPQESVVGAELATPGVDPSQLRVGGKPMAPDAPGDVTTTVMSRSPNERPQTMTISVAEPTPAPPPPEVEPAPAVDLSTATKRGIENVKPNLVAPAAGLTAMLSEAAGGARPEPMTFGEGSAPTAPLPAAIEPAPLAGDPDLGGARKRGIENVKPASVAPAELSGAAADRFATNATVSNFMTALYRPLDPVQPTPAVAPPAPPPPQAEAPKPSKADAIMSMSKEDRVKAVQQMLSDLGIKDHMKSKYKNGGIDGVAGTDTNRSVTLFQARMGITQTGASGGDIDAKTVAALVERHEMTMGNKPIAPSRPTAGFNTVAAQPADFGAVEPDGPDPAANDRQIRRRQSFGTGMSA